VTQFEELIRVPLIMRGPGVPKGERYAAPVSLVDLFATVLGLRGVESGGETDGMDLTAVFREGEGGLAGRALFSQADHDNEKPDILHAVRVGHLKLIRNRLTQDDRLYDLLEDPNERRNLSLDRPGVAAELAIRLDALLGAQEKGRILPRMDEVVKRRLEALGYKE